MQHVPTLTTSAKAPGEYPMADQSTRVDRRWLYIPFIAAGIVFFAYYLLWRAGASEMEKAALAWIDDQRAAGMEVSHNGVTREGFPFFLRLHIDSPEIAAPGAWRWRGERLFIDALPYDLNRVIFTPTGEQHLSAAGFGAWRMTADDFRASIANDKAREWLFSVTLANAKAIRPEDGAEAAIANLVFDLAPDAAAPETLVLTLVAGALRIDAPDAAFHLSDLQTVMGLTQTHMLYGPGAAAQWRAAGGALIVTGLNAGVKGAKLSVSGLVRLDGAGYPTGRLDAEIANPAGLAQTLGEAGALSRQEAEAAAAGLTLMAIANGGKIAAPIELKDGAATIAGVKIADLPEVSRARF